MQGLYFEELEVGRVLEHAIMRTVTEIDNTLFSCLTHNSQPLHIDYHFAASTEWGKPLVNSIFTLGVMIGVSVSDTTLGTTIGNLGMTDVKFPKPVFHGDTIHVTTEVVSRRDTRSRPDAGIVELLHKAINQKDFAAASVHLGGKYIQHNPLAADGPEGLKAFLEFAKTNLATYKTEFKRVFADGDNVIVHAHAKANPGQLNAATQGVGTTAHLTSELFQLMAQVKFQNVHYRGSAPAMQDLVGGTADVAFDNIGAPETATRRARESRAAPHRTRQLIASGPILTFASRRYRPPRQMSESKDH